MKTMKQAKMEYVNRIEASYKKALVNAKDEVDVSVILYYKGIADKPKNATLKTLRFATDTIEAMAERG